MGRWDNRNQGFNKNHIIILLLLSSPIMALYIIFYINPVAEQLNPMIMNSFPEEQRGSLLALGMTVWLLSGYLGPMYLILRMVYHFTPKISQRLFSN